MKKLIIEEVAPGQFILLEPSAHTEGIACPVGVAIGLRSYDYRKTSLLEKVEAFFDASPMPEKVFTPEGQLPAPIDPDAVF